MTSGLSLEGACDEVGLSVRTVQRWRKQPGCGDGRYGPRRKPANALSAAERRRVLSVANSPEFRDQSPKQIVPALADRGEYIASESTFYRILREEGQLAHRGSSKPRHPRPVPTHTADGPCQLWSWDITYLKTTVRGRYFYLYLFLDVYSRKVVGWDVFDCESDEHSAALAKRCCESESVCAGDIVLHSDNGGPMRGSTMLATLQKLGVVPSFSRPGVSDDNPFSEALFRVVKHTPAFPPRAFETLDDARAWVDAFVRWYNHQHRHSALKFVSPSQRHDGLDANVLAARDAVYQRARRARPDRWTGSTRNWSPAGPVTLNRPRLSRRKEGGADRQAA